MGMFHLVRHGQASAGTHDYDRLSPLGRRQAELLGQWWARQGFEPEHICHGTLTRQRDTAHLALPDRAGDSATRIHAGLNEYQHRSIEKHFGTPRADAEPDFMTFEDYVSVMQRWRDHQSNPETPDIEPWADFAARGWATMISLAAERPDSQEHVFFTSGGIIATTIAAVLGLDFAHTIDAIWRIRNASITTIHHDGHHGRLVEFNGVPHLQAEHDASLITLI